jgi:hypothetical protein
LSASTTISAPVICFAIAILPPPICLGAGRQEF